LKTIAADTAAIALNWEKAQCGRLRRKVIVGNRSRALPSMKTSACKSPTVVASRTLSGTQAGLPRRAGSVRARERRWRSRRYGGGHTTARRPPDDIPPLSVALARQQDARRLCSPGRQWAGTRLRLLPRRRDRTRQAKVLTNDEARRIAFNVAMLPAESLRPPQRRRVLGFRPRHQAKRPCHFRVGPNAPCLHSGPSKNGGIL
jgi:hypothetical protein